MQGVREKSNPARWDRGSHPRHPGERVPLGVPAAPRQEVQQRRVLRVRLRQAIGGVQAVIRCHVVVVEMIVARPGRVISRDPGTEDTGREDRIATARTHHVERAVVVQCDCPVTDIHIGSRPIVLPPCHVLLP